MSRRLPKLIVRRLAPAPKYVSPQELLRAFPNGMKGQSEDSPSYSILLNGIEANDYFTSLQCSRAVRQKIGGFQLSLDDYQFKKWGANIAENQPVIYSINGTRIFKGRIDKINQKFDKTETGFLTSISGRDDAGALQDTFISGSYTDSLTTSGDPASYFMDGTYKQPTPENILTDILAKYALAKGTEDPDVTQGTIHFHNTNNYLFPLKFDGISTWAAIEQLSSAVEAMYARTPTPFFLDFWLDENDALQLTRTGEIVDSIDVGDYGGKYIKTRDWTYDVLPIKTDVWVVGDPSGCMLPLISDSYWAKVMGVNQAYPWVNGAASSWFGEAIAPLGLMYTAAGEPAIWDSVLFPHLYKLINPGPIMTSQGITITNNSSIIASPKSGSSLQVHVDLDNLAQGIQQRVSTTTPGEPGAVEWSDLLNLGEDALYWGMRFDRANYPAAPWVGLCQQPRGRLNFYNNSQMDETMGQICGIQATIRVDMSLMEQWISSLIGINDTFWVGAIDSQPVPMMMRSPTMTYNDHSTWNQIGGVSSASGWQSMFFPLGPSSGGSLTPTEQNGRGSSVFNWDEVQEVIFAMDLGWLTALSGAAGALAGVVSFDIYMCDMSFVKQVVAEGIPKSAKTTRSVIVTDTTIPNYMFASNKANSYALSLAIPQSYIDYDIFGRPDLQAGHVFKAEGLKLLIRESSTTVTKDAGYSVHVKAWKPIPSVT